MCLLRRQKPWLQPVKLEMWLGPNEQLDSARQLSSSCPTTSIGKEKPKQSKFPEKLKIHVSNVSTLHPHCKAKYSILNQVTRRDYKIHQWMPNIVQFLVCLIIYILDECREIICHKFVPRPFPICLWKIHNNEFSARTQKLKMITKRFIDMRENWIAWAKWCMSATP